MRRGPEGKLRLGQNVEEVLLECAQWSAADWPVMAQSRDSPGESRSCNYSVLSSFS